MRCCWAMAIHELATNAVKYGALSNATGTVALSWQIKGSGDARGLALEWARTRRSVVGVPTRKGFGSTLIERALPAGNRPLLLWSTVPKA